MFRRGIEILPTLTGRRLLTKLPADTDDWVPELFFAEVAAVLRRVVFAPTTRWPASKLLSARNAATCDAPGRRVPRQMEGRRCEGGQGEIRMGVTLMVADTNDAARAVEPAQAVCLGSFSNSAPKGAWDGP